MVPPPAHEQAEAHEARERLRAFFAHRRAEGLVEAVVRPAEEETASPPEGWKRVSFIRHGQGYHNLAAEEWTKAEKPGVPYSLETDPEYRYLDPELTGLGQQQAQALQARAATLSDVEVIIVSPMRRATQTALIGFERAVAAGVPVIAQELCHETAGKHTCDKRLSLTELKAQFPQVDYSECASSEEDPYWGDGLTRETPEGIAERGAKFARWLLQRPEQRIVVAAHSGWLLALFNAVFEVQESGGAPDLQDWFATGEMRTALVGPIGGGGSSL